MISLTRREHDESASKNKEFFRIQSSEDVFQSDEGSSTESEDDELNLSLSQNPMLREAYKNFFLDYLKNKESEQESQKGLNEDLVEEMRSLQIERSKEIVYVQCDKCDKIRILSDIYDPTVLPKKWYCSENPDKEYNKCEVPEEDFPEEVRKSWINNLYNAGSLVWGKVDGFPWWPGIVNDSIKTKTFFLLEGLATQFDTPTDYYVTFLGDYPQNTASFWLKPDKIKVYKSKNQTKFIKYCKNLEQAVDLAEKAVPMSLLMRLEKYSEFSKIATNSE